MTQPIKSPFEKMSGHIIVCGTGTTSSYIIDELENYRKRCIENKERRRIGCNDYIVIDNSDKAIARITETIPALKTIVGDATDDNVLLKAQIEEAYGIFPVLPSEKDNLYITITARQMNPGIRIVSSTADIFGTGQKLYRAGADSVVSPNFIGGLRLVSELVRPHVTQFLDELLRSNMNLQIHEVSVEKGSELDGKTIKQAKVQERTDLILIAIQNRDDANYIYNPTADQALAEGDTLVAFGNIQNMMGLHQLAVKD